MADSTSTSGSMVIEEEKEEIPASSIVQYLWNNLPSFSDVELEGTDGVKIHCHKLILAGRSKVFERLLFGNFSEASNSVVKLGYPGILLQYLVEYVYTDEHEVPLLSKDHKLVKEDIPVLIQLASAADYFGFPKFCKDITMTTITKIEKSPTLAWCVLVQDNIGNLGRGAMDIIRIQMVESIQDGVPYAVPSDIIESLVSDKGIQAEEIDIFRMVYLWSDKANDDNLTPPQAKVMKLSSNEDGERKAIAKSLIQRHIRLSHIKATEIESIVEPSGLVSKEALFEVYKEKAKILDESTSDRRCISSSIRGSSWESTGTAVFERKANDFLTQLLKCDEMQFGVYSWTIKILNVAVPEICLGVVSVPTSSIDKERFFGYEKNGWAYEPHSAHIYHDAAYETVLSGGSIKIEAGSIITMTLDLTQRGTLTARKFGEAKEIKLFDDMLMEGERKMDRSFVPAVGIEVGEKVAFLGFGITP